MIPYRDLHRPIDGTRPAVKQGDRCTKTVLRRGPKKRANL